MTADVARRHATCRRRWEFLRDLLRHELPINEELVIRRLMRKVKSGYAPSAYERLMVRRIASRART